MSQLARSIQQAQPRLDLEAAERIAAAERWAAALSPPPPKMPPVEYGPIPYAIGEEVKGEGRYMGLWKPKDRNGVSLGRVYYVFASHKDIEYSEWPSSEGPFQDAAKQVAAIKNFHGHDGEVFKTDTALYRALKNGSRDGSAKAFLKHVIGGTYNGGWFIPPVELLCGMEIHGEAIQPQHLFAYRHVSGFDPDTLSRSNAYWSCSETTDKKGILSVNLKNGETRSLAYGKGWSIHCRPMRLKEITP